jgi:hypothetical protein
MFKLFFSHKSADSAQVEQLKSALRELLPNMPFEDVALGIPSGEGVDWQTPAASRLETCDGVICIVGAETYASGPVDWEIAKGLEYEKPLIVTRLSSEFALPPSCVARQIAAHDWNAVAVAGRIGEMLVSKALFLKHDWGAGKPDAASLWNQYSLMVQSWEALINRRQTVNTVYVTASTALLGGIGVVVSTTDKTGLLWGAAAVAIVAFLGAALGFNWRRTVVSYGTLSKAKAKVITALEAYMPAQLFDAEWGVLESKRYKSTTESDKQTALAFTLLFVGAFVVAVGIAFAQLL